MKKRAPFPSHPSLLYACVYVAVIVYCGFRLFPAIIYLENVKEEHVFKVKVTAPNGGKKQGFYPKVKLFPC